MTKYRTIVADPPWPADLRDRRASRPRRLGKQPYATMTLDAIRALPVAEIAEPDAHLYLWTTHRMLPESFAVASAWGFKYECVITWVKHVGFTPYSWMYSTEFALFCRRGSLPLKVMGKRIDLRAHAGQHSRKPDAFLDLVEEVSPGPYLEMFSRRQRFGWDTHGDESLGDVSIEAAS